MKKHSLPTWAGCLLLVALTFFGTLRYWRPITAESGTRSIRVLRKAYANEKYIHLDLGNADNYRIPRTPELEALLAPEALGREYNVTAVHHSKRGAGDYYEVYALSGTDGTVYLTIEDSETARQAILPERLALLLTLDTLGCGLLIWKDRQRRSSDTTETEEDPTHD